MANQNTGSKTGSTGGDQAQGASQQRQGGQAQAPGQQKPHTVTNPTTGESREVTQEQWRNRRNDPTLEGFERPEGEEDGDGEMQDTSQG